jgi:hypothetical protein
MGAPLNEDTARPTGLALMREPFPAHQISTLPKGGVKLSYVGHAALTDRLLDADPSWTWEPVANPEALGLPIAPNGMWIRLTVCGVTRLGYGDAGAKKGGDAVKEIIGDALRNAAMRFGAALDLWHKGELHKDEETDDEPTAPAGYAEWLADFEATADNGQDALLAAWQASPVEFRQHMPAEKREALKARAKAAARA